MEYAFIGIYNNLMYDGNQWLEIGKGKIKAEILVNTDKGAYN